MNNSSNLLISPPHDIIVQENVSQEDLNYGKSFFYTFIVFHTINTWEEYI